MGKPSRRRLEHMTAKELAPLERLFEPQYPERLVEVATVLYIEALNQGHEATAAAQLALAQTEALRDELGGQRMYMTKGQALRLSKRDREIYAAFNGRNLHVLARRYQLCEERARQIVRKVQAADLAERQGQLSLDA